MSKTPAADTQPRRRAVLALGAVVAGIVCVLSAPAVVAQQQQPSSGGAAAEQAGTVPRPPEDVAFEEVTNSLLPMSPAQIRAFHDKLDRTQKAAAETPAGKAVELRTGSIDLSLAPGNKPPAIRVAPNHVAVLTFYDMTGAAWPIEAYTNPATNSFQVEAPLAGGNYLTVFPKVTYGSANLAVKLKDEPFPLIVSLSANIDTVDARTDVRVLATGPNASPDLIRGTATPKTGDAMLMSILDGVPPLEARELKGSPDLRAWSIGSRMYVRTTLQVLSPAWSESLRGAGGITVYDMPAVPVILASVDGQVRSIQVSD